MNVRTYEVNPFAIDAVRIIPVGAYSSGGISDEAKNAILDAFEHVAWIDDQGQTYVDAIRDAFFPPATLLRIQAVYTQSGTVYTTDSLDSLKSDLVVTAVYTDSTTETVTTYTLSGTLTAGQSTITVSYGGKTTTFKVNVTAPATLDSISAVYTQSGTVYDTDSLDSLKTDLVVTATYSDSTTETIAAADYTLSGTLTEGTSTITVSYAGKSCTFTVTVTDSFNEYVKTGLVAHWDGILNTSNGHDGSVTEWEDLTGNGYDLNLEDPTLVSWTAKSLVFSGTSGQYLKSASIWTPNDYTTIEIVLKPTTSAVTVIGTFDLAAHASSATNNAKRFVTYTDGTVGFVGISGNTWSTGLSDNTDIRSMVATYDGYTVQKAFVNGSQVSLSDKTHSMRAVGAITMVLISEERPYVPGSGENYQFTGEIYAIRVYNRILTDAEIASNHAIDNARFNLGG